MDPKDDPEARIRELERPLAEQARTSELGTAGSHRTYPPPPTTPMSVPPMPKPYPYSQPYPHSAPHQYSEPYGTRRRGRGVWLVGGLVLAILAITVAMVVGSLTSIWSDVRDLVGSDDGGATVTERDDTVTIDIRDPQPTVAPVGGQVSVSGSGVEKTVTCEGGSVSVSGAQNTVEITGQCAEVEISGVENVVTIEATDTIEVSGVENEITYRTGTPVISDSGLGSSIRQG